MECEGGTLVSHPKEKIFQIFSDFMMRLPFLIIENVEPEVRTCQLGLWEQLTRAKCIVNKLECLVEDATAVIQTAAESSVYFLDKDIGGGFDPQGTTYHEAEIISSHTERPEATDYAVIICSIYSMVKQDYMMHV